MFWNVKDKFEIVLFMFSKTQLICYFTTTMSTYMLTNLYSAPFVEQIWWKLGLTFRVLIAGQCQD